MKKQILGIVSGLLLILTVGYFSIADNTKNTTATVNIVEALTLSEEQTLRFGQVTGVSVDDSLRINEDGTFVEFGVHLFEGSDWGPAEYEVTGPVGETIEILLPDDNEVVLSGDGSDIRVNSFHVDNNIATLVDNSGTGEHSFTVGATAYFDGPDFAPDEYTGTFNIEVIYN